MHNLNSIVDGFKSLKGEIDENGVNKFIADEKDWLRNRFNNHFETKLRDARNANSKQGVDLGENTQEKYLSQFLEIVCSDEFNNLEKIKKIIQIEDKVKQIKNDLSKALISSLLEFERHYETFISNFAGDLIHKCSLKVDPLFSDDEEVLQKRYKFFETLYSDEVAQDPRKFLEILTKIDNNPQLIDTISEIKSDEDLKSEIEKNKKLVSEYKYKDDEVQKFATAVNEVFNGTATPTFKDRIDALFDLSKSDSVPDGLKDSFNFLSKVDDKNFLPAIIPDYYQPNPKSQFRGWGLKAVFKGMDLTIDGKEVKQILCKDDKDGKNDKDILAELKQTFKDDPKLFAYAVIDFFRRAEMDIDLVFNGHPNKKLSQSDKRTLEIKNDEATDVLIHNPGAPIDSEELFNERLKLYCGSHQGSLDNPSPNPANPNAKGGQPEMVKKGHD